ncbi:MAG: glycosyl hydrolase family 18 protein [Bacillota bacterium]|nr:glycosyl hydrolase family 18 protein [Bacillota bacterium]
MRIYVVQPGDSVWSISRRYGMTPDSIITANGLETIPTLVVGQSLVIPTGREKNFGYIETNAFIQPGTPERDRRLVSEVGEYLTYVTPFSHHVNADGSLTPLNDDATLAAARASRTAPLLSVTNISGEATGSNFSTPLIDRILNDNNLQTTVINNILSEIKNKGYYGVIVDFERISPENRQKYNDFLRKLATSLHAQNYVLGTALAPKTYDITTGSWHGAHDYRAHGEIVDFTVIMTYEWGWSGGPPMAVAPLDQVRQVISYAASVIPPKKILMGIPLYGYDWTLPYLPGGEYAKAIGHLEAVRIASTHGAAIEYDTKAQSPHFNYTDEKGARHEVWFEDARSIRAKFLLASQYGLRGVSYWVLAQPFPQNWIILDSMFNITKVIR